MAEIDLPITVKLGRKEYALNLNIYRNAYYRTLNDMKVKFTEEVTPQILNLPTYKTVSLTYTLYPKTKRLCDVANICSIVDKFFCDALVKNQKLKDDNYNIVKDVKYQIGKVDKENPRVTVTITGELNESNLGSK